MIKPCQNKSRFLIFSSALICVLRFGCRTKSTTGALCTRIVNGCRSSLPHQPPPAADQCSGHALLAHLAHVERTEGSISFILIIVLECRQHQYEPHMRSRYPNGHCSRRTPVRRRRRRRRWRGIGPDQSNAFCPAQPSEIPGQAGMGWRRSIPLWRRISR